MTCQVKFSQATRSLVEFSTSKRNRRGTEKAFVDFFIEIGPHAALKDPLKQILNTDSEYGHVGSDVGSSINHHRGTPLQNTGGFYCGIGDD